MPPKNVRTSSTDGRTGPDSWAHLWIADIQQGSEPDKPTHTARCRFVHDDGTPCEKTFKSRRNVNQLAEHVRGHFRMTSEGTKQYISATTPPPTAAQQQTENVLQQLRNAAPMLDKDENWIVIAARKGMPALLFNDIQFRQASGTAIDRNSVPEKVKLISDRFVARAIGVSVKLVRQRGLFGTLAIDIGTHLRRYLAYVLIINGRAIFYTMTDGSASNGRFTTDAIREDVNRVRKEILQRHKVSVVCVVADNASNMQGIVRPRAPDADPDWNVGLSDAEVRDRLEQAKGIPLVIRCGCHVLQLAIRDLFADWRESFETAKEALRAAEIPLTECETRWGTYYRVMKAASVSAASHIDSSALTEMKFWVEVMKPFDIATDILQRDNADLFDTLRCFSGLASHFKAEREALIEHARAADRVRIAQFDSILEALAVRTEMMFNRPFVILALFGTGANLEQEGIARVEMFVASVFAQVDAELEAEFVTRWEEAKVLLQNDEDDASTRVSYLTRLNLIKPLMPKLVAFLETLLYSAKAVVDV